MMDPMTRMMELMVGLVKFMVKIVELKMVEFRVKRLGAVCVGGCDKFCDWNDGAHYGSDGAHGKDGGAHGGNDVALDQGDGADGKILSVVISQ